MIFVVLELCFNLVTGLAVYNGVLTDLFDHGRRLFIVFYIGASSLTFFMVALLFLKYVQSCISNPLGDIYKAACSFVGEKNRTMSGAETMEKYQKYTMYDSEISVLAKSLTEMMRTSGPTWRTSAT